MLPVDLQKCNPYSLSSDRVDVCLGDWRAVQDGRALDRHGQEDPVQPADPHHVHMPHEESVSVKQLEFFFRRKETSKDYLGLPYENLGRMVY